MRKKKFLRAVLSQSWSEPSKISNLVQKSVEAAEMYFFLEEWQDQHGRIKRIMKSLENSEITISWLFLSEKNIPNLSAHYGEEKTEGSCDSEKAGRGSAGKNTNVKKW